MAYVMKATKDESRVKAQSMVSVFTKEFEEAKNALELAKVGVGNKYVTGGVQLNIDVKKLERIARRREMRARICQRFADGGKVQFFDHDRKMWRDVANPKWTSTATYRDIFEISAPDAEKMLGLDEFVINADNKRKYEVELQGEKYLGKATRIVG